MADRNDRKTVDFDGLPKSIQNLIDFLIQSKAVSRIVLFGSQARGDSRPNSDYDFAVWTVDRVRWLGALAEAEEGHLTLLPVDLAAYDDLSPEHRANVDREGRLIYG